jgi:hypothetical protein
MKVRHCPHCGSDQRGKPIPEEYLRDGSYGDWDGVTPKYFWRTASVEIRGIYDGGLFFQCADCDGTWHRWSLGHPLRERAAQWLLTHGRKVADI